MDAVSTALLQKALDGLSTRMTFTAQNIANASTPNYRPVHVSFEADLQRAASEGLAAIEAVEPRTQADGASSDGVRLDLELASASQTALRYRALTEILDQQLRLERVIINGGR